MITMKPYAAFGYVIFVCDATPTDVRQVRVVNGHYDNGYIYYTKGLAYAILDRTGEILHERKPGWLHTGESGTKDSGTLHITYAESTQWVCIPRDKNFRGLPNLESLAFNVGENISMPIGTSIFLVNGSVTISGRTFVGPSQIRVRLADAIATVTESGSGLKFLQNAE